MQLNPTRETLGSGDQTWLGSAHGTDNAKTVTIDISAFTEADHCPDGYVPSGTRLGKITASGAYGPYAPAADGTDEVQTITVTASGGTFTITVDGETTSALAYNASPSTVQTAIDALSNTADGDVTVGGSAGALTLTYGGQWAGTNVALATLGTGSLTGGSATIAQTTAGAAPASDGTEVLAGYLFCDVATDGVTDPQGALLEHCSVIVANLPGDTTGLTDGWFTRAQES